MNKYLQAYLFVTFLLTSFILNAQSSVYQTAEDEKYWLAQDYIASFQHFAIEEMYKTGIPASITLAQGLHESNYGRSRLARLANNHFGAKAHNTWAGPVIHHDDDAPQEAFRKYESVEHSYRDHSKVLAKKRYAFLYHLNPYDYKAWAHGLKKAGYATDPKYAYKLINIIETYQLFQYDQPHLQAQEQIVSIQKTLNPSDPGYMSAVYTKPVVYANSDKKTTIKEHKNKKKKNIPREKYNYQPINTKAVKSVYAQHSPEESVELAMRAVSTIERPDKEWYKGNRAIFFNTDMMPSEVAFWYDVDLDKLLKWNYAQAHVPFEAGKPVYLEPLRGKAGNFSDKTYKALRGQNLIDVAIASGIKLERLMKLNKVVDPELYIKPGEIVQLKRKSRKKLKTTDGIDFSPIKNIAVKPSEKLNSIAIDLQDDFKQRTFKLLADSYYRSKTVEITPKKVQVTSANNLQTANQYQAISYSNYTQTKTAQANYIPNIVEQKPKVIMADKVSNPSSGPIYHTVEKGQTLYRLSVIYDVDVDDIKALNNLKDNTIKTGSSVRVR